MIRRSKFAGQFQPHGLPFPMPAMGCVRIMRNFARAAKPIKTVPGGGLVAPFFTSV